jgi:hypothetical protein
VNAWPRRRVRVQANHQFPVIAADEDPACTQFATTFHTRLQLTISPEGPPDATVDLVLLVDPGGNAPKISRPRRTIDPQRAVNLLTCQRLLS